MGSGSKVLGVRGRGILGRAGLKYQGEEVSEMGSKGGPKEGPEVQYRGGDVMVQCAMDV